MAKFTRRQFLGTSLAAAGTVAISGTKSSGKIIGANDTVRIAVAGLNGRGGSHVGAYTGMKNVAITHLVDPDQRTYKKHLETIAKKGGKDVECVTDIRKVLENKNVDAVSIATPNHWHALMTIWACQAGKDVYVEKPCSHNVSEGRIAVEVARKYDRVVQHGTQSRSDAKWAKLAEIVKSGKLGKLLVSYGLCYKPRGSIGAKPVSPAPAEVDFDLWLGPATEQPHHANLVHYNWHWFWDFGNGDIGNQGVHQMDVARWLIPGATLPKSVLSLGGRFGYSDQGQTANTQWTVMDFDNTETKLVFEVRGLKTDKFHDQGIGNVLKFESGIVAGHKFYPNGKDVGEALPNVDAPARGTGDQFTNFINTVKSRKRTEQYADILEGHYSSALCHLANISYRLAGKKEHKPETYAPLGGDLLKPDIARFAKYLDEIGVKPGEAVQVGTELAFDPKSERFTGIKGNPEATALANSWLTRQYRKGFVVPNKV